MKVVQRKPARSSLALCRVRYYRVPEGESVSEVRVRAGEPGSAKRRRANSQWTLPP